jgi:hypothetical protein
MNRRLMNTRVENWFAAVADGLRFWRVPQRDVPGFDGA